MYMYLSVLVVFLRTYFKIKVIQFCICPFIKIQHSVQNRIFSFTLINYIDKVYSLKVEMKAKFG